MVVDKRVGLLEYIIVHISDIMVVLWPKPHKKILHYKGSLNNSPI